MPNNAAAVAVATPCWPAKVLGHFLRVVKHGGAAGVILVIPGELPLKIRVILIFCISGFQFMDGIHHRFGYILTAIFAISSDLVHVVLPS